MAINESVIRRIIREEARRLFNEGDHSHDDLPGPHFRPGSVRFPSIEKFGDWEPPEGWDDEDYDDEDEPEEDSPSHLDERKKKYGASAGTLAAFEKGSKKSHGGAVSKRRAGFDAAKKSAEKWADNPGAVAQAATIKATGKPAVAKGEKRKRK